MAVGLFLTGLTTMGQGTISFRADLDGAHAVPPNSSPRTAFALFSLDASNLFEGSVYIPYIDGIDSVDIFRSSNPSELGTVVMTLPLIGIDPGDGRIYGSVRTLSDSEISDLQAGFWWANVTAPGFPNGEFRGQISVVPEPTTFAFFGVGIATLFLLRERKKEQAYIPHRR